MSLDQIPALEPDADVYQVPLQPPGRHEPGVFTFTRALGAHLADLLHQPVTALVHRENPWHRRPCPKVFSYEITVGPHQIVVTSFEVTDQLIRDPVTDYTIMADGRPIAFERRTYLEPVEWQLARAVWIYLTRHATSVHGGQ